ncbi:MAG: hypothetical protein ACRDY2_12880 [Acidimicrobiales bacterium]
MAGIETVYNVPPRGFDYLTATSAERKLYSIPASVPSNFQIIAPPSFLAEIPLSAFTNSHWGGWIADSTFQQYTEAAINYQEPHLYASSCPSNSEVSWTGLGGWNSGQLAQDGTGANIPGLGQHQAWTEVLPTQPGLIPQPLYATAGDGFVAETIWNGGAHFTFRLTNTHTEQSIAGQVTAYGYDGSSADFIIERPLNGSVFTNLSKL